jgi:hypothetical protein
MNNLEEERDIKPEERALVEYLIRQAENKPIGLVIPNRVFTMKDGGMGSIKFKNDNAYLYQRDLITADYRDSDGIPILISIFWRENDAQANSGGLLVPRFAGNKAIMGGHENSALWAFARHSRARIGTKQ